jgi:phosphatidylglycerol lysyltransferase
LDLVRRHGWNATSFQVMQPGFQYFFHGDDACVGYVDTGHGWVAAGAPLCEPQLLVPVARAFIAAARAHGRRACFFGTEERFAAHAALPSLLVGEQAVWEPSNWAATLEGAPRLREQLRRARAKGVRIRAATPAELTDRASPTVVAIQALVQRWRGRHEMAPMGFLVDVDPLALRDDHRVYLAELEGDGRGEGTTRLVGLLAAAPIFARRGWLVEVLVRAPGAPNGTTELLVDEAMRAAALGADALVTLGLAPLAGRVAPPLRWARSAGAVLFDFQGLHSFKSKLRPERWDPIYLSYPEGQGVASSVLDVLRAFARGGLLRFGLQTLLRGPAVIVRLLALALLPWTIALAASDGARWFPRPGVKWAWVVFDVALAAALLALTRRWRDRLARALMVAIGADAALTALQIAVWNLPRVNQPTEAVVLAAALAAPLLAFLVLWRTRTRRR